MVLPVKIEEFVDNDEVYQQLLRIKEKFKAQQIKLVVDGKTKGFWERGKDV